jgi:hypothetical protein
MPGSTLQMQRHRPSENRSGSLPIQELFLLRSLIRPQHYVISQISTTTLIPVCKRAGAIDHDLKIAHSC